MNRLTVHVENTTVATVRDPSGARTFSSTSGSTSIRTIDGRGSRARTVLLADQQQTSNEQLSSSSTPVSDRRLGHPIDCNDDQQWALPDDVIVSLGLLPTASAEFDSAELVEGSGMSVFSETNQEPFSFLFPTPLPDMDTPTDQSVTLMQEQSGLDLNAFNVLIAPSPNHGEQESASLRSKTHLHPLDMSSSRLVEKLVWLTGSQSRLVPVLELDGDWIHTSQGSIIRSCLKMTGLTLPKNAFRRWIQSYFMLFHPHVALLHIATFRISHCHHVLLLAMAAIGAIYSYNQDHAIKLYEAASKSLANNLSEMPTTQRIQASLLLAMFDGWSNRPEMHIQCSIVRRNLMSNNVKALRCASPKTQSSRCEDWHRWVEAEGFKRTMWFSYWFLTLMNVSCSISTKTPWLQDCTLELPYEESLWVCEDSSKWNALRTSTSTPPVFADAYRALMGGQPIPTTVGVFGLATLMCALFAHVHQTASAAAGSLSEVAMPLVTSCEAAMNKWLSAIRAGIDNQHSSGIGNVAMAEASIALWNVSMVHLHADVQVVEMSQSIVSDQRDEHVGGLAEAVPRSARMSEAMQHALNFLRGPISHGVAFLAQTGCLNLNPCLSRLGIHCVVILAYWLRTLEVTIPATSQVTLSKDELDATDAIRDVLRASDTAVPDKAGVLLSECCLRVWSEAMGHEKLPWAFDEQKRHILRPEVLFSRDMRSAVPSGALYSVPE
ncbi:C2H2 finger domain-containing protein [Colletotrichum tofieldiae]|uniref:C2H2 finger domain-containing protein n=1 Tax=Colletotrichum tofieldiae TaxID=708197 RepID=A0A166QM13_9PEZI|nr:C2H2 finger domain-containing protein [Colletotrichum tofieldiae]